MATTTLPQPRTGTHRGRWIAGAIAVVIIAIIAALIINRTRSSSTTTTVASGTIVAAVAGSGSVAAAQSLNLSFLTSGDRGPAGAGEL